MKSQYKHINKYFLILSFLLTGFVSEVRCQTSSNPNGFESNSITDWTGGGGTETCAINSANVRTGTRSLAMTTTSTTSNKYWYAHTPYGASAVGTYVHFIYWAKSSVNFTSVDATLRYSASNPPTGAGTAVNGTATALSTASWTRVRYNTGNFANRWYFPSPRRTTGNAATIFVDDIVIYTSNSNTTDIVDPGAPTGVTGNNVTGISWTNGADGSSGATGVQATLLFKRTGGTVGSNDLTLNDQGRYSLTSTEGPSVVGNWTLIDAGILSTATNYNSIGFTVGEEYAIVHRDLAYNYSASKYVVIAASTLAGVSTQATTAITTTTATGNGTISYLGTGITASGICWSTITNPTTADSKTTDGPLALGSYTGSLTGLTPNTLYYVRAWANTGGGDSYGNELSFVTIPAVPTIGTGTSPTSVSFVANWAAPTQGAASFTYEVQVTATSGDYSVLAADIIGINSSNLSRIVTGLNPTTTYYYRVRVRNASGVSAWSAESLGVTTLTQSTLTINISPTGSGTATGDGVALPDGVATNFTTGEEVTLAATPSAGYGFVRWIRDAVRINDNPYDVTVSENKTFTALFGPLSCMTYGLEDVSSVELPTDNYYTTSFNSSGKSWNTISGRLNTSAAFAHTGNQSVRVQFSTGALITPVLHRPTRIGFWARIYTATYTNNLAVYYSLDGGLTYSATPILTGAVTTDLSWTYFQKDTVFNTNNVRFKIASTGGTGNAIIDDVYICEGPDNIPPTLTFDPTNLASGVGLGNNLTITSNERLFRYIPSTGAFIGFAVNDPAFSNADTLATFLSLKKVSDNSNIPFTVNINASGKILTINPISNFDYLTEYKLSIVNVSDSNFNAIQSTQYSQFTTVIPPSPVIKVEEIISEENIANNTDFNVGTIYSNGTITRVFRIINTGTDPLNIASCALTTGTKYTITAAPAAIVNPDDTTTFTVNFTPGATAGVFSDIITIMNNDLINSTFKFNLIGIRGTFMLPYTYESGCTTPIMNGTELKHDYTSLADIPGEITLESGNSLTALNFYQNYNVFQAEGNCMPPGSSVLKVGQGVAGLQIDLPSCGEITMKWCSNGYRKVKISDNLGNIYEQSASFLPSNICYTTNTVVNDPNPTTIHIEFLGNDPALLTTVYYLKITPYNASIQSSARDIVAFSTGIAGETVRIYDNVIIVTVPSGTDLATITPSLVTPSPFATVSPGAGTTKDFSSGPVQYTVTSQSGLTKDYMVKIEHAINYGGFLYSDSIAITVPMNRADKTLELLEVTNSTCQVPVSGNGSDYTIHFLDPTDMPLGGYTIAGPSEICIGTVAEFTIINAVATNNPSYKWAITGSAKNLFTIIGDTISDVLRLRAPNEMVTGTIDFSVIVEYDPSQCVFLRGEDNINVGVTDLPPDPITGITANCAYNGLLTVTAIGSTDATSYNWDFTPFTPIVSQSNNSIVLNIGTSNDDISAQVNTQNGCGITYNSNNYDIPYAKEWSKWTGAMDNDWHRHTNWTDRVPKACTDIVIPDVGGGVQYPIIQQASGECHYITFEPGGAVLNLQKLDYVRAYVQLLNRRDKWYTLTAPLKNMFAADYAYQGTPVTKMRLFDQVNPDSLYTGGVLNTGTWTRGFNSGNVDLTPGQGFAFWVDQRTYNFPNPITFETSDLMFYFPREASTDVLMTLQYPYSTYSGRLLTDYPINLPRNPNIAYRFAMEDASNQLQDVNITIDPGLNFIGNPMMTHLNFNALYASNSNVISNKVKFWNGSTFTTFMSGSDLSSDPTSDGSSISPMQAFFVEKSPTFTSSTLNIDLETHFFVDLTTKLRSTNVTPNTMHIITTAGNNRSSTAIAMRSGTSNGVGEDDAFKLFTQFTEVPEVYTLAEDVALDINQFDTLPYRVPVGLKTSFLGNVNYRFENAESFNGIDVTLLNTRTGEQQNLKTNNQYTINHDGINTDGYLFVEFRNASTTGLGNSETCTRCIQVYQKDTRTIQVISPENDKIKSITVWENSGKMLFNKFEINQSTFDVDVAPKQSCVVRVTTSGSTYVVKLLMK